MGREYATRDVTTSGADVSEGLMSMSWIPIDQPSTVLNVYATEAMTELGMRRIDKVMGGCVLCDLRVMSVVYVRKDPEELTIDVFNR